VQDEKPDALRVPAGFRGSSRLKRGDPEIMLRVLIEVRYQRGIHLPELDLWLDPPAAKARALVSHAHADHFARHEETLCSTVTAGLLRRRFGVAEEKLRPVDFHEVAEERGFRLRLLPAGHIAGSAMLHVTRLADGATLLYTGDFKVRRGRTAEPVVFQQADLLLMETTFGLPHFVFPATIEVEAAVMRFVNGAIADGETPVLLGYPLGKAQEALALLHEHGVPALLHAHVAAMTAACRAAGVDGLPEPQVLTDAPPPGHAVIVPPNAVRSKLLRGIPKRRVAMLSGWALMPGAPFRYRVDEAFPLSDHADHPGLLECVQRVRPKRVLTVHGHTREFAAELRARGIEAWSAEGGDQLELAVAPLARAVTASASRHTRPVCAFADFTDACRLAGETGSRLEKTGHLARYLRGLENHDDLALAAGWLGGRAISRTSGRRSAQAGSATLRRALLRLPGAREERYRELSLSKNDAARTARLFLQELPLKPEAADLACVAAFFDELARATGSLERIDLLAIRLRSLHPAEGETLVKLLTGDLRIGLGEGLVEDVIAMAFASPPAEVRRAHMLTGDPGETARIAREGRLAEVVLRPFAPVKVVLAAPMPDEGALVADDGRVLWPEPKSDGIRAQLHKQGDRAALFSGDLPPLDTEFPELVRAALTIPDDCVLDGEIIAYAEGRRLTFHDLRERLGKPITSQTDLFAAAHATPPPVRFIAFDLLYLNGEDLLAHPLGERRRRLENLTSLPQEISRITVERLPAAATTPDPAV
jgi:DNA ligase 1